jgi:hypothetical protein
MTDSSFMRLYPPDSLSRRISGGANHRRRHYPARGQAPHFHVQFIWSSYYNMVFPLVHQGAKPIEALSFHYGKRVETKHMDLGFVFYNFIVQEIAFSTSLTNAASVILQLYV